MEDWGSDLFNETNNLKENGALAIISFPDFGSEEIKETSRIRQLWLFQVQQHLSSPVEVGEKETRGYVAADLHRDWRSLVNYQVIFLVSFNTYSWSGPSKDGLWECWTWTVNWAVHICDFFRQLEFTTKFVNVPTTKVSLQSIGWFKWESFLLCYASFIQLNLPFVCVCVCVELTLDYEMVKWQGLSIRDLPIVTWMVTCTALSQFWKGPALQL